RGARLSRARATRRPLGDGRDAACRGRGAVRAHARTGVMTDITAVRFADPWAFSLLALVVAGIGVALLRARRPAAALLFSSLGLLPATRAGLRVRLRWLLVPLRVLALARFVVALARPQILHVNAET